MNQSGGLVVGQVVEARLQYHGVISLELDGDSLRRLVDRAGDRQGLVGEVVVEVAANDAILVDSELERLVGGGLTLGDDGEDPQRQPLVVRGLSAGFGDVLSLIV